MEASPLDPTVALIVAIGGFFAATIVPIILALINRTGTAQTPSPDSPITHAEYTRLEEQLTRLDDENDRLVRENRRMRDERDDAIYRLRKVTEDRP